MAPEISAAYAASDGGFGAEAKAVFAPSGVAVLEEEAYHTENLQASIFKLPSAKNATAEVVPCGLAVGVRFNTEGVMVLSTGKVFGEGDKTSSPSEGKLHAGDIILAVNSSSVESHSQLNSIVNEGAGEAISLTVKRAGREMEVSVTPVKSAEDGKYKLGCWVRDSTQGIGTITYYNPENGAFGALGHGILDVDTGKLMTVKDGSLLGCKIVDIKKGEKGSPGELTGVLNDSRVIGSISLNSNPGLYGYISDSSALPSETMKTAPQEEIYEGPAKILSNIEGNTVREYDAYIEKINGAGADESKDMVIRITDQELIAKTNGIVQGMSGSPIIQDGALVGAVTHVFVQNPQKGYGIFIENMMKQEMLL